MEKQRMERDKDKGGGGERGQCKAREGTQTASQRRLDFAGALVRVGGSLMKPEKTGRKNLRVTVG